MKKSNEVIILALTNSHIQEGIRRCQESSDQGYSRCMLDALKAENEGKTSLAKASRGIAKIIRDTSKTMPGVVDPAVRFS